MRVFKAIIWECVEKTRRNRIYPELYVIKEYSRAARKQVINIKMTSAKFSDKGYKAGQVRIRKVCTLNIDASSSDIKTACEKITNIIFKDVGSLWATVTINDEINNTKYTIGVDPNHANFAADAEQRWGKRDD